MKARDIMATDVPAIALRSTVGEAVRFLRDTFGDESFLNAAPGLIVLNEREELAGILTPLSVLAAMMERTERSRATGKADTATWFDSVRSLPVEAVMERQPLSVTPEADISEVAELFVRHRFQRIPVVDGKKVAGIIYRSRLLFAVTGDSLK